MRDHDGRPNIVKYADEVWGEEISERSLRPLLTGMKKSGVIVWDGRLIALSERGRSSSNGLSSKRD
jgi:hypothetical protein